MIWIGTAVTAEAGAKADVQAGTEEEAAMAGMEEKTGKIWPASLLISARKLVGSIDMYDNYTFVEVPREYAGAVLKAMKDVKIKGKNVHVEKANGKGR